MPPKKPTVHEFLTQHHIVAPKPGKVTGKRVSGDPLKETEHFYTCKACGQAVDMRDLGQVLHHEMPGHEPLPVQ